MKDKYCKVEWWINQIEDKCKTIQKESEEYKKSNREFMKWSLISFFTFVLGIIIGLCDLFVFVLGIDIGLRTDLNAVNIIKSIGESCETTLLFIATILAGFAINEYRNRSNILKNASSLRPEIFEEMIQEMGKKGILQQSQVDKCISYIQNGESQMRKSGNEGLSYLKDVINNVINKICS
ncbi:hypothetical protein KKP97_00440 [Methanothermococcus sp. SCGC AD-155-C09]|nr:hypothetical protein [Methanothermococcus sp. SCGC AD-155-C09]